MKRKKRNTLTLLITVVVLMVIGCSIDSLHWFRGAKERQENKKILEAFDRETERRANYTFKEKALVSKEQINNYQSYVDPSFVILTGRWDMYREILDYLKLSDNERKERKEFQKFVIERLQKDTSAVESIFELEKEKYALMDKLEGRLDPNEMESIRKDMRETREKLSVMRENSPGWKYVIDATARDGTGCRFVFVATDQAPFELKLVVGEFKQ